MAATSLSSLSSDADSAQHGEWVLAELADSAAVTREAEPSGAAAVAAAHEPDLASAFAGRQRSLIRLASRLEAPKKKKAAPKKVRRRAHTQAQATPMARSASP